MATPSDGNGDGLRAGCPPSDMVKLHMAKNSKAEEILAEKMRKVGWKDLGGAGISAGDVDTLRGPKRPLRKGPRGRRLR